MIKDYSLEFHKAKEKWKTRIALNQLTIDEIITELADYTVLMDKVTTVYEELSGLTEPHSEPATVISKVNDRMFLKTLAFDDLTDEDEVVDGLEVKDGKITISVEALKDYLDIEE